MLLIFRKTLNFYRIFFSRFHLLDTQQLFSFFGCYKIRMYSNIMSFWLPMWYQATHVWSISRINMLFHLPATDIYMGRSQIFCWFTENTMVGLGCETWGYAKVILASISSTVHVDRCEPYCIPPVTAWISNDMMGNLAVFLGPKKMILVLTPACRRAKINQF